MGLLDAFKKKRQPWDEKLPNGSSSTMDLKVGDTPAVRPRIVPVLPQGFDDVSGNPQPDAPTLRTRLAIPPDAQVSTDSQITESVDERAPEVVPSKPMAVMPRKLSPVEQATADYNAVINKDYSIKKDEQGNVISRGKDRDKDHNWWDVLKSAGFGALRGLATGGLGGALAGGVTGAIGGAADRNADEKMKDQMFVLPRLQRRLGVAREQEQYDLARDKEQADIANRGLEYQTKTQDMVMKQFKPLLDSINADGQVTPDEAKQWEAATGMAINPYDNRKFKQEERGGTTYATPENGAPDYKPVESLPIKQDQRYREVTVGGDKYVATEEKALDTRRAILNADTQRAFQISLKNMEIANKNATMEYEGDMKKQELAANREAYKAVRERAADEENRIEKEISDLSNQLRSIPQTTEEPERNPEYERLQKQIDERRKDLNNARKTKREAEGEFIKADKMFKGYKKPPKLQGVQPKGNGKTYTQSDIERVIRQ